jgi:hypothetical protein
VKLTEKKEKIARLALDNAAQPGERQAAAAKLIESFCVRGVSVEDIEKESVRIEYRERAQTQTVYRDRPVEKSQPKVARAPHATTPSKRHDESSLKVEPERSHAWVWIVGVAAACAIPLILLTSVHSNSTPSPAVQPTFTPALTPMTAEERKQQEAGWEQFKEADRKERELLKKQEAERRARYEAEPEQDSVIGATPAPQ